MGAKFDSKVTIVMVAFNEAKNIERVLREYHNEVYLNASEGSEYLIYLYP